MYEPEYNSSASSFDSYVNGGHTGIKNYTVNVLSIKSISQTVNHPSEPGFLNHGVDDDDLRYITGIPTDRGPNELTYRYILSDDTYFFAGPRALPNTPSKYYYNKNGSSWSGSWRNVVLAGDRVVIEAKARKVVHDAKSYFADYSDDEEENEERKRPFKRRKTSLYSPFIKLNGGVKQEKSVASKNKRKFYN